ncbi:unnamed protein product [Amoebophrya sp. A120]|nr:unnamed protein product [Amoebophrya sp. A120]|eukprot:GSA120T00002616001.1
MEINFPNAALCLHEISSNMANAEDAASRSAPTFLDHCEGVLRECRVASCIAEKCRTTKGGKNSWWAKGVDQAVQFLPLVDDTGAVRCTRKYAAATEGHQHRQDRGDEEACRTLSRRSIFADDVDVCPSILRTAARRGPLLGGTTANNDTVGPPCLGSDALGPCAEQGDSLFLLSSRAGADAEGAASDVSWDCGGGPHHGAFGSPSGGGPAGNDSTYENTTVSSSIEALPDTAFELVFDRRFFCQTSNSATSVLCAPSGLKRQLALQAVAQEAQSQDFSRSAHNNFSGPRIFPSNSDSVLLSRSNTSVLESTHKEMCSARRSQLRPEITEVHLLEEQASVQRRRSSTKYGRGCGRFFSAGRFIDDDSEICPPGARNIVAQVQLFLHFWQGRAVVSSYSQALRIQRELPSPLRDTARALLDCQSAVTASGAGVDVLGRTGSTLENAFHSQRQENHETLPRGGNQHDELQISGSRTAADTSTFEATREGSAAEEELLERLRLQTQALVGFEQQGRATQIRSPASHQGVPERREKNRDDVDLRSTFRNNNWASLGNHYARGGQAELQHSRHQNGASLTSDVNSVRETLDVEILLLKSDIFGIITSISDFAII